MIQGYDVSHWNNTPLNIKGKFLIAKASEGEGYKDAKFLKHLNTAKELGCNLFGAYHYARTDTDVRKNVQNFISQVKDFSGFGTNLILALDLEGKDMKRRGSIEWALAWLDMVYNLTGIRPLIYTSSSYTKKLEPIFKKNYGLWVAHYTKEDADGKQLPPKIDVYPFYAIWQYSNGNGHLDHDVFNGKESQFLKYCRKS